MVFVQFAVFASARFGGVEAEGRMHLSFPWAFQVVMENVRNAKSRTSDGKSHSLLLMSHDSDCRALVMCCAGADPWSWLVLIYFL